MSGFAKAWRERWEHRIFRSKQEAAVWAWITDCARWRAHEFSTKFGKVRLERGQLLVSERQIAADFGLHKNVVRRLVRSLIDEGMIGVDRDHKANRAGTIVTVLNYNKYQGKSEEEGDRGTGQGPQTGPRRDQDGTTREEGKEREEEKRGPPRYAFGGRIIRLTHDDFARWQSVYYAYPDLRAELEALDNHYDNELKGAERKNWFTRCSRALKNGHQKILEQRGGAAYATGFQG